MIGIDEPLYASVYSAVANLAPNRGAVIHAAWYGEGTPDVERRLTQVLDDLHPGWARHVVHQRFMPGLLASNALVTSAAGALAGRPGPAVPDVFGLYVAGDWAGGEGMLADACLMSAQTAASPIACGPRAGLGVQEKEELLHGSTRGHTS